MAEPRRAILLAPGPLVATACKAALPQSDYSLDVIPGGRLYGARDAASMATVIEQAYPDPDILLIGDEIFPLAEDKSEALTRGMRLTFLANKAVLRGMMRRRFGRIIAFPPRLNDLRVPHAAAVGSLSGFIRSVSREVGSRGVTGNVVAMGSDDDGTGQLSVYTAVPRAMTSTDLAGVVQFRAGENSGYFTGQVLCVDGGLGLT